MGPGQSILITGASSGIGREAAMRLVRAGHLVLAGGRRPDALAGLARAAGGRLADADLRRLFDTNVFGLLAVTRAFVPAMRERGGGRVVNVGSIMGRVAMPLLGAYNASKHAVAAATAALRMELAPFGVTVVLVEPGAVRTTFAARALAALAPYLGLDLSLIHI